MNIRTTKLDKELFLSDLAYLNRNRKEKLESSIDSVKKILDSCNDAIELLRNLDSVEDREIQSSCRQAVFAQMYDTKVDNYYRGKRYSQNYISHCNNKIALIQKPYPQGVVMISKYGEIIIDEGILSMNGHGFFPCGCKASKIINGKISSVEALYSNAGEIVFPFGLFDEIKPSLSLSTCTYKKIEFSFGVYGNIANCSSENLQDWKDDSERENMFISPDNVVFVLSCQDYFMSELSEIPEGKEFLDKIAPYRLTAETIQQELDRRTGEK